MNLKNKGKNTAANGMQYIFFITFFFWHWR